MILLTGPSGFIGSYLLKRLSKEFGKDNIVLLTSKPIKGYKNICYKNADLNEDNTNKIRAYKFDCVYHIGAFTPKLSADANLAIPNAYNIVFTVKLISALSTDKIVFASSLDVYAPNIGVIDETSTVNPTTLYGKSKLFCEDFIIQWGKQTNRTVQILRIGHVYGIGEEVYKKFLPQLISKAILREPMEIWGDGTDLRAFIHVIDVIKAITKASELNEYVGPINICASKSFQLKEYIKFIENLSDEKIDLIYKERAGSKIDFRFDTSKMNKFLINEFVDITRGLTEEITYLKNKYN